MMKNWQNVPLGELLKKSDAWIELDPTAQYKEVTVRLWGKGVVLRREVSGAEIADKRRLRVKAGQFILSRIDARNGAFGLIPQELDRAIVSNDFPVFEVNTSRLLPAFLGWLSRTSEFVDSCRQASEGTTNRVRLKENKFLTIPILLPPLAEQQRIVAKIEQLAAKIEEAQKLHQQILQELDALFISSRAETMNNSLSHGSVLMEEAAILERGRFGHRPRNEPRFYGGAHPWIQINEIESSGKFIKQWTQTLNDDGLAISRKFPKGTLLISIAATIGAVGILDFDCCIPDSIVAITPKSYADRDFMYHYLGFLRTHLERVAPQSAQKNINLRILTKLPFPTIDIAEQCRIAAYLDNLQAKIDHLKHFQAQTQTEIDALLPSILDKAFKGNL